MSFTSLLASASAAVVALGAVSRQVSDYRELGDDQLLEVIRLASEEQRLAAAHTALAAGEIARRSSRSLGSGGLAQRGGFRTAEELVRSATGSTARDAGTAVRVGQRLGDSGWLSPATDAVLDGLLSVDSAEAIRAGLGEPGHGLSEATLMDAAAQLCAEAADPTTASLDADRLYRRARELRDEIDAAGIALREEQRREQRALRFHRKRDGGARLTWDLDPESSAVVGELYDRATSPRRGGPRFVEGADTAALAERITADSRTTEQLASDVFVELLRIGANADSSQLLRTGAPSVRVLITEKQLRDRDGHGFFEGQPEPASIETVERMACAGSCLPIVFDKNLQPVGLGRENRLFTRADVVALAARDGGCGWPGCDRPPSWTEAHHVEHWERDHGSTDVTNGVLLCRHHHLLLHNNHWEIEREGSHYWLVPPFDVDPTRTRIAMTSGSGAYLDLRREAAA